MLVVVYSFGIVQILQIFFLVDPCQAVDGMSRVSRACNHVTSECCFPNFLKRVACGHVSSVFAHCACDQEWTPNNTEKHQIQPCRLASFFGIETLSWDSTSEKSTCDVYLSNKKFLPSHSFSSKGLSLALSRVPPGVRYRGP